MITKYFEVALERARYEQLEDGSYAATVRGLRGVIAIGDRLEDCRKNLAEVIEEWILLRVAHRLPIPRLGGVGLRIRRAS